MIVKEVQTRLSTTSNRVGSSTASSRRRPFRIQNSANAFQHSQLHLQQRQHQQQHFLHNWPSYNAVPPSATALHALPISFQPATGAALLAAKRAAASPLAPLISRLESPATAAMTAAGGAPLSQLILAFTLGGLFFSTAIAIVSMGFDNIKKVGGMSTNFIRSVWTSLTVGLAATRLVLFSQGKNGRRWHFREAWKELRSRLAYTRKVAANGVKAMRLESTLYAAALGQPGLVPMQYLMDRLLPYSIQYQLQKAILDGLKDAQTSGAKRITLSEFNIGTTPPKLEAARVYDLGSDAIAFDVKTKWKSDDWCVKVNLLAAGGLARIPVNIRNLNLDCVFRVILTPLCRTPPGFGAMLVSFPTMPRIGLDVTVAGGEITRVPWLKSELQQVLQNGMAKDLLWPKRTVIPIAKPPEVEVPILSKKQLKALESTDPLLEAEQTLEELRPFLQETMQKKNISPRSIRKLMSIKVNDPNEIDPSNAKSTYEPGNRKIRVRAKVERFAKRVWKGKGPQPDMSKLEMGDLERELAFTRNESKEDLKKRVNNRINDKANGKFKGYQKKQNKGEEMEEMVNLGVDFASEIINSASNAIEESLKKGDDYLAMFKDDDDDDDNNKINGKTNGVNGVNGHAKHNNDKKNGKSGKTTDEIRHEAVQNGVLWESIAKTNAIDK